MGYIGHKIADWEKAIKDEMILNLKKSTSRTVGSMLLSGQSCNPPNARCEVFTASVSAV